MTIVNRELRAVVGPVDEAWQVDATTSFDDKAVLDILAAVGDRPGLDMDSVRVELASGDLDRAGIVDLVAQGLSATEESDLGWLLDESPIAMSAGGRNLIEALLGRAELSEAGEALAVSGLLVHTDLSKGLSGLAGREATIEAINLSDNQDSMRVHHDDTFILAKADGQGRWSASYAEKLNKAKEGDQLRVRARSGDGAVSNWITVRVRGKGRADTRNAVARLARLQLFAVGRGRVELTNANSLGVISEPGAELRLTNVRTGDYRTIIMDANGALPPDCTLKGGLGDQFDVAVSDGVNNTDFAESSGSITCLVGEEGTAVDLDELPAACDSERNLKAVGWDGVTYAGDISAESPQQGYIGNCYFVASAASVAQMQPNLIKQMISENDDGSWTVRFQMHTDDGYREVPITVDGRLWAQSRHGDPKYGSSTRRDDDGKLEMWYPVMEKAYAAWKGSYHNTGQGDWPAFVLEAMTGRPPRYLRTEKAQIDDIWGEITSACDDGRPVTASTFPETERAVFTNSGIVADHAYSVLGYTERDGSRYVKLRNPWAQTEPAGDGKDDGIFELPITKFAKYYTTVTTVEPTAADY